VKKIDNDPNLHGVYNQLRKDLSHKLSIEEFNRWTAANPSVTAPLMMLQLHIRLQIIGEQFWVKLSDQRKQDPKQGKLNYVKDLQRQIVAKNKRFREKQQAEEKERHRLLRLEQGRHANSKDHVQRKESILLKHFHLRKMTIRPAPKRSLSRVIPMSDLQDVPEEDDSDGRAPNRSSKGPARDPQHGGFVNTAPIRRRRSIVRPNLAPDQKISKTDKKRKDKYNVSSD
jgi:hypothetical protein